MTFYSRISLRLVGCICITFGIVFGIMGYELYTSGDTKLWYPMGFVAFVIVAILALFTQQKYIISDTQLLVQTWIFPPTRFDLIKLVSIVPTRSILSAPACSLRRIQLDFTSGDALIISPRNQDDFLEQIRRINPKVRVEC